MLLRGNKRMGIVGDWLPNQAKFDVCFDNPDGSKQWYVGHHIFEEVLSVGASGI